MKRISRQCIVGLALFLAGAFIDQGIRSHREHTEAVPQTHDLENGSVASAQIPAAETASKAQAVDTKNPDPEILQLRGEVAALKSQVATLKNERNGIIERKAFEQRLGKGELKISERPGEPFQRNTYYPAELIQDVGNDTAPAALQTFIAAMTRGDYQAVVRLSPAAAQEQVQRVAEQQGLGRYVTSDSQGLKIAAVSETANESEFVADIDFGPDKAQVRAHFYTTNEMGAWKVMPNVSVEGAQ
jgi:hypothetical protein